MAIFRPMLGTLSGKMAGVVFSHNKAGYYIRLNSMPVSPDSQAQIQNRARFGSASQAYHALSDMHKAEWGEFALLKFNPKGGINRGQYSGYNAFVSLRAVVSANIDILLDTVFSPDEGEPITCTPTGYQYTDTPPVDPLQATINDGIGNPPKPMEIQSCTVREDGTFDLKIGWVGVGPAGLGQDELIDGVGNKFGFSTFLSNAIPQRSSFVNNPRKQLLGCTDICDFGVGTGLAGSSSLGMACTGGVNIAHFQEFPAAGDICQVQVYATSKDGMAACIGSVPIIVIAVP